jgi:hypothetical protein
MTKAAGLCQTSAAAVICTCMLLSKYIMHTYIHIVARYLHTCLNSSHYTSLAETETHTVLHTLCGTVVHTIGTGTVTNVHTRCAKRYVIRHSCNLPEDLSNKPSTGTTA